jgi:viroplasmin and RNaseH domain-containing protein
MTLSYEGIKLKSEVNPNTLALVYPVSNRIARNNRKRSIERVEVVTVYETTVKVTKSNLKAFHEFFTQW